MSYIQTILGWPLGWVMRAGYFLTHNYGISLLIFTIVTRLIMVPFTLGQQKSSMKMAVIKPQMDELQKKYGNNKQKLNEEMMDLYKKEGYNPMAGCLPLLIQLPILFGLIDVVYKPLTHILGLSKTVIDAGVATVNVIANGAKINASTIQLELIKNVHATPEAFHNILQPDVIAKIQDLNLSFLGIDLMTTPTLEYFKNFFVDFNPVILIPILSGLTSLFLSLLTTKNTPSTAEGSVNSMKGMMLMMPVFSTYIALSVPAGVGLYWVFSNIVAIAQNYIVNKIYNPKEMAEKAKQEREAREVKERQERIEAKKLAKLGGLENKEKAMTQKEKDRQKLAEARKLYAEKYGEEYQEPTDKDVK